ncbi:hypothetical protein B0I33_104517 [Prauserella shujinwangii]|uniref:Uncharacterized protein n=1 Tax=Prauserella shujinwangii TaxID=1453103 RepID=A0A2T0LXL3_9PSEU|nr:hypothetical protein B0I33_104517 [Prauserella shujinwangii]
MKIDKSPSVKRAEEMLRDPDKYFANARSRARSAVTGRFVTKGDAKRNPRTTVHGRSHSRGRFVRKAG